MNRILKKVTIAMGFLTLSVFLALACVEIAELREVIDFQKDTIQIQEDFVMALLEQNDEIAGGSLILQERNPRVVEATVTSYSPHKRQTDGDPRVAASMRLVREGTVAVSRDLFWSGWTFGRKIYIDGHGVFEINDLMNDRFERRVDVFQWSKQKARAFGSVERRVALLGE